MKNSVDQISSVLEVNFKARTTLDHRITMFAASELNSDNFILCNDKDDAEKAIKDAGGFALMTVQREEKRGSRWVKIGDEVLSVITKKFYDLFTAEETLKRFRRAGGIETAKKSYTAHGYLVTSLLSTDLTKEHRARRTFKIID